MFKSLKRLFGAAPDTSAPHIPPQDPEPELTVPDIAAADFLRDGAGLDRPLIVDVREQTEWDQVHVPEDGAWDVVHIPMNRVPGRLNELPADRPIVVLCAHGNRSYGVAHYLLEAGYDAYNLAGGITQWHIRGGAVVVRRR